LSTFQAQADLDPLVGERAEIVPTRIAAPHHTDSAALFAYWQSFIARGGLVLGRDLPAREIAPLMSKLNIMEPMADGDFRVRLAGSGLMRRFGEDVTGRMLSSLYDAQSFQNFSAGLRSTLDTGVPHIVDVRIVTEAYKHLHMEYICLPVKAYDGLRDWVLTGAFYFG
jgi:hypothetical protein